MHYIEVLAATGIGFPAGSVTEYDKDLERGGQGTR